MPSESASRTSGEPEISIVIPAFNEDANLESHLGRIISCLQGQAKGKRWEIIVVDDGSSDRTQDVSASFYSQGVRTLRNPVNMGKGFSVRRGILRSTGKYVLFIDADLSSPIEDMERMLQPLRNGYDVAIASRAHPESRIARKQGFLRSFLGRIFLELVHRMNLSQFSDTQCGFKAFRREAAQRLFKDMRVNGYAFDVEMFLLAGKYGMKVAEVPITWRDSERSSISVLSPRTGRMLVDIFLLRWRHR